MPLGINSRLQKSEILCSMFNWHLSLSISKGQIVFIGIDSQLKWWIYHWVDGLCACCNSCSLRVHCTLIILSQVTSRMDWRIAVSESRYDPQCASLILTGTVIDMLRNSDTPVSETDE